MKAEIKGRNTENSNVIEISMPGDKSIAHRALIIGALAKGEFLISNFPQNLDCMATKRCMEKLGVSFRSDGQRIYVKSPGYENFSKRIELLDALNSGTTARLLSGVLSGISAKTMLIGDMSLLKRPMSRIISPLSEMGARIKSMDGKLPLQFEACDKLKGINYSMPVASAQVKSCVLLAGFLAEGVTNVKECVPTRDHTERMLKYLGADITISGEAITIKNSNINSKNLYIPGDISSSAFFIACGILGKDIKMKINNVLLNKGRRNYIDILKNMGAHIEVNVEDVRNGEEIGTIQAQSCSLKPVIIEESFLPSIIDEVPIISVLASFAEGISEIRGVGELKFKESNRIHSIIHNLVKFGIEASYEKDTIIIKGRDCSVDKHVLVETFKDHRIALAFAAMSMRNIGTTVIDNWDCTRVSLPGAEDFFKEFLDITVNV